MKKKRQKSFVKKISYIQSWGTYSNETLVVVAMNHDEIVSKFRKLKVDKKVIEEFEKDKNQNDEVWITDKNNAMMWFFEGKSVLWFRDWKNDWKHWDTLVHELSHAIHNILEQNLMMANEDEARAYQFEFLFREIRRKLWDLSTK